MLITFHQYILFSACSFHEQIEVGRLRCNLCEVEKFDDKIRSRKMLIPKELAIGNFMYNVYLPSLEKFIYHVDYVHILSKNLCGKLRHDDFY